MMENVARAKIVVMNYHAFKPRERLEISKGGRALLKGRHAEGRHAAENGAAGRNGRTNAPKGHA
jgi:type III restriction enzyme